MRKVSAGALAPHPSSPPFLGRRYPWVSNLKRGRFILRFILRERIHFQIIFRLKQCVTIK